MQRIARLTAVLMAVVLAAAIIGCDTAEQESTKKSPSEVAPLYLEAMRGNVSGLKAYNPDTVITEQGAFGAANETLLDMWGVTPSPEQETQLTEAMLAGLSKVQFSVVDEKVDDKSATVTLAIQGIDMTSSLETQFETIGGQITDQTEDETIITLLDKAWREAPLLPEPTNVDMPFTAVSDGRWIADPEGGTPLGRAYMKMGD
ncbi:MAG: hypothetical protein ACOX8V_03180 [Thermoleophilia bacterium]|jgi:uncharacterized lipoprotein YehR (DUF1307 family)